MSDAVTKTLNTLFNPVSTNVYKPTATTPFGDAVTRAGSLAVGYGGLAFALRRLIQLKEQSGEKQTAEKLRSYVQARYPKISLDPSTRDTKREVKERATGASDTGYRELEDVQKYAAVDPSTTPESPLWQGIKSLAGGTGTAVGKDQEHAMAKALALAGILGGAGLGWRTADQLADRQRKEELEEDLNKKQNQLEKLLYEEYQRTRGLEKAAARDLADVMAGQQVAEPGWNPFKTPEYVGKGVRAAEKMWWVWAAATLAMGYKLAKGHVDENDPARQRLQELQAFGRQRAKAKGAPVLLDASKFPTTAGTVKPQVKPKSHESVALPDKQVDKEDPYADLLPA
jgi:hypothetical protein